MSKLIIRKLNSNSGATMLMALLLFLVATVVSAVIISTAQSAAMNIAASEKDQQAYLSLSSAAEYIEKEINKCKGTRSTNSVKFNVDKDKYKLGPEVEYLVGLIDTDDGDGVYPSSGDTVTITVDDCSKILPVSAVFQITSTYNIIVKISVAENNQPLYETKLYFYSKITPDENNNSVEVITWPTCEATKTVNNNSENNED